MACWNEVGRSVLAPINTNLLKDSFKLPTNIYYWNLLEFTYPYH